MGLFDKLRSEPSDTSKAQKQDSLGDLHADYYFIGNKIDTDYLDNPILIIEHRQNPQENKDPGSWSVVKCNEPVEIDRELNLKVCVHEQGWIIGTGNGTYRSNIAWLLSSEEVKSLKNPDEIDLMFDFPSALRGTPIPVGSKWSEDELKELLISLNLPDAAESMDTDESKSRWERFGEASKQLF